MIWKIFGFVPAAAMYSALRARNRFVSVAVRGKRFDRCMTHAQVLSRAQAAVAAHGSQKALAARLGISTSYLSDMLNGRRDLSEALLKVAGVSRKVVWRASKREAW